jgi:hypothetical protein
MIRNAILGVLALSATACVHTAGNFEGNRFQSTAYPYSINYAKRSGPNALAGDGWRVDNYMKSTAPGGGWVLKKGAEYWVDRGYDDNGDGEVDRHEREPFYDLRLEHRERDASIWVRMVPISRSDQRKDLRVFAERYVESAAGSGMVAVHFGSEATISVSKRYASRVLSLNECRVGDRPAQLLDFEVANVDQLQLSESSRWSRGRLAIVRTGYLTAKRSAYQTTDNGRYPVLMLVGLSAAPGDFDELSKDFDDVLARIALGTPDARPETFKDWKSGSTCAATSPAASVGAPAPAQALSSGGVAGAPSSVGEAAPATAVPSTSGDPAAATAPSTTGGPEVAPAASEAAPGP